MDNKQMMVKKGGSTKNFNVTITGITDYTDYFGTIDVLDPKTKVSAGITRVINPDVSNGFIVALTPGETNTLGVGKYLVVLEITKDPVGNGDINDFTFNRELSWQLEIKESLINN